MKTYTMPNMGKFIRVENMKSNSGNPVANQYIIYFENGVVFQSYDSIICIEHNTKGNYLGQDWDYSNTTSKYRALFLCETTKETREALEKGEYKLLKI